MKKNLTLKQVRDIIRKNNAIFKAASPARKRVLVAKDVVERIKSKQYAAQTGGWVIPGIDFDGLRISESIQPMLVGGAGCTVCALGAIAMSCTVFNNKTTAKDLDSEMQNLGKEIESGNGISNKMNKIFTKEQLALMEIAFEGRLITNGSLWGSLKLDKEQTEKARIFFYVYYISSEDRMKAIMENVIKHKGEFKP